jgi:hypothetical protein
MAIRRTKGPSWAKKKAQIDSAMKAVAKAQKALAQSQKALAAAQKVLRDVGDTPPGQVPIIN